MNFRSLTIIALIAVVVCPLAFSQKQNKEPGKVEQQELSTPPRVDIYQILDQARRLSDEARGLVPQEAEIRLQATLADSVWPMDPALGQRLLLRSFDLTIASLKEPPGPTDPRSSSTDPDLFFRQINSIAARHDAKLTKQLSESWQVSRASVADKADRSGSDPAQLSYLILGQSANHIRNDEQRARLLFQQSVNLRVLPAHCFFLMSQRNRAVDITDKLFGDALDVLAQRPISEANEILLLSSYLFSPDSSISYLLLSGYNAANAAGNASGSPKNPALAKRYLSLVLTKLSPSEAVPTDVVYFALKNLVPQYQALAPELLNDVYAKLGGLGPSVSKDDSIAFENASKDLSASEAEVTATWEKRLQNADKIDSEARRDLEYFTILLSYLLPQKDFPRAAQVVTRIGDQDLKHRLTDYLNLRSLQAKLEKPENASSASEDDCNKIKDPLLKVVALSSLGQSRLKQKATVDALHLFAQATVEAKHISNDQDRLQARLMLVQLYVQADTSVAFDTAAMTFKEINKSSDFNMRRSNFSLKISVYGLSSELLINAPFASSLTSAVARMCRANCMETFQTCRLLTEKEMRVWATFEAVRTALLDSARESKASLQ